MASDRSASNDDPVVVQTWRVIRERRGRRECHETTAIIHPHEEEEPLSFYPYSLHIVFSFETTIQPRLGDSIVSRVVTRGIWLDFETHKYSEIYGRMSFVLGDFKVPKEQRRRIIRCLIHHCETQLLSNPESRNGEKRIINLPVDVKIKRTYYRPGTVESSFMMIPTRNTAIEALRKMAEEDIEALDEDDCPICLEKINNTQVIARMPCSHYFHSECIIKWLRTSHYCPLCRYEMPVYRLCA